MAEAQLKQVFDGVDAGTMKPAGVERKIEFHMVPLSNGGRAYERVMPTSNHSSGAFGSGGTQLRKVQHILIVHFMRKLPK